MNEYNDINIFTYSQESFITLLQSLLHQSWMKYHCINIFICYQILAAMKINSLLSRINKFTNVISLTFILDEVLLHKYFHLHIKFH